MSNNPIISHSPHYAMPSHNVKYVPGDINEIRHNTITKVVNINSTFREDMVQTLWPNPGDSVENSFDPRKSSNRNKSKSTDFIIRLPTTLDKVVSMKLSALDIPNTGYVLSSDLQNNIFQLTVSNSPVNYDGESDYYGLNNDGTHIIEIASGNYTVDELCTYMNDMFDASENWTSGMALDIQVYANTTYGRFYFVRKDDVVTNELEFDLDFSLPNDSRDIRLNFGWLLGFRTCCYSYEDDYNASYNWPYDDSFWPAKTNSVSIMHLPAATEVCPAGMVAEGIIDLAGPKYLFLLVNDFNNNVNNKYTSILDNAIQIPVSNILARISKPDCSDKISFDDVSDRTQKSREYFGPVSIDKLHIKIVDEYGRIINLNNNDISLLLEFECLYNL
jgi:hypothetical protein